MSKPMQPVIKRLEAKGEDFSIDYPYCTEFIISPCKIGAREVRKLLMSWGESMIVAEGDNLVKVPYPCPQARPRTGSGWILGNSP